MLLAKEKENTNMKLIITKNKWNRKEKQERREQKGEQRKTEKG